MQWDGVVNFTAIEYSDSKSKEKGLQQQCVRVILGQQIIILWTWYVTQAVI